MQVFGLFGGDLRVQHEIGHSHDAVHWRADFMAHVGQEFALCAVRDLSRFLRTDQLGFYPLAFRDILFDGNEVSDPTSFGTHRSDGHLLGIKLPVLLTIFDLSSPDFSCQNRLP